MISKAASIFTRYPSILATPAGHTAERSSPLHCTRTRAPQVRFATLQQIELD